MRIFEDISFSKIGFNKKIIRNLNKINIMTIQDLIRIEESELIEMCKLDSDDKLELISFKRKLLNDIKIESRSKNECFPELCFSISKLSLCNKMENVLYKYGFNLAVDICMFSIADFNGLEGIGKSTAEKTYNQLMQSGIIREYLLDNQNIIFEEQCCDIINIIDDCNLKIDKEEVRYELNMRKSNMDKLNVHNFFFSDSIVNIFKIIIKNNLESKMALKEFNELFPKELHSIGFVEYLIENMIATEIITVDNQSIYRIYPDIIQFSNSIKDVRNKQIFKKRINGETYEEIGQEFNISRQRIRQILLKIKKELPRLSEDKYKYMYENYNIPIEVFTKITNEPNYVYHYLEYVSEPKNKRKDLEDILDDENILLKYREKVEKYLYKDYVEIGNCLVKKERYKLIEYVLENFAKTPINYDDFKEIYNTLILNLGLEKDTKFKLTRGMENRITKSDNILCSIKRNIKYYNINTIDFTDFLVELDLNQYKNVELSTLKLFNEHQNLMEEYDIQDEYELHNLLKKLALKYEMKDVEFTRMPMISFGIPDRNQQIKDLLFELAPIKSGDFANEYQERYGILAETVLASNVECIKEYFCNGEYKVDYILPPECVYEDIKKLCVKDFYLLEDLKQKCINNISHFKKEFFNPYTIKKIGYNIFAGYIIRNSYKSAFEYFSQELLKQDIFKISDLPKGMKNLVQFNVCLSELKNSYEIIECEPYEYINIKRLEKFNIGKRELEEYCDWVYNQVQDEYFTIYYLQKKGIQHKLYDLGFDEMFYASIITENKERFSYQRIGCNKLFSKGNQKVNWLDFIEKLVYSQEDLSIDVDDLLNYLKEEYNLKLEEYNFLHSISNTGMYYSKTTGKLYSSYENFYERL